MRCKLLLAFCFLLVLMSFSRYAFAVVGYAERYDEFDEENLETFHDELVGKGQESLNNDSLDTFETVSFPSEEQEQAYNDEVEEMKAQMLNIPKRDRLHFGLDGQYTYESNVFRRVPRQEESDSILDLNGYTEVDLGGKKTDLRFEVRGGKQWNIHFPESDFWEVEERLRYRRKYFRKITHSVQSRLARHSSKTIEIDEKKVRWDSQQNTVFNYAFSRKLSMNLELDAKKRLYTTEPFDQDSEWSFTSAPAVFWNFTPKSRVSMTYTFGANRIRTKTGDANSHEIHLAYFGRVTRKSSLSFDFSYSYQRPRSIDTQKVHAIKLGAGYILQLTPKTQLTVQAIRNLQNTSSNSVSGTDGMVVKNDVFYTNDSINISANSRLTNKLNAILTTGISHFRNEGREGDTEIDGRQWTFPTSLTLNYIIRRWIQVRLRYTFAFRTGDEKADTYRAHTLMSGVNMNF